VAHRAFWCRARGGVHDIAPDEAERRRSVFWRLWIVFFLAASAGLMVLSQAAGIITAYGGGTALASTGPRSSPPPSPSRGWGALDGRLAHHSGGRGGAHAVALAGNAALTLWPGPGVSVLALALVGLGYVSFPASRPPRGGVLAAGVVRTDGQPDLHRLVRGRHHPADKPPATCST